MFFKNIYSTYDKMIEVFKLNKISMTEQEIAEIFAINKLEKRQQAISFLINKYFSDISRDKADISVLNEKTNLYAKIMQNPESYAIWLLNLTADLIYANSLKNNGIVKYQINSNNSYIEFKFDIYNNKKRVDCDKEITMLISKNGIVVDLDGDYASIARNRNNLKSWNARFPEELIDYLPLFGNKQERKKKVKAL